MNLQTIYQVRGIISRYIKKLEVFLKVGLKFLAFLYLFRTISGAEIFTGEGIFNSFAVHAVLAVVATLLPSRTGILIALALIVYNVFQASFIGAALVGLMLLVLYIAVARTFPDQIYFLALVPLCINWNLYLLVPLFAGMYVGTVAIVPVVVGVLVWGLLQIIQPFMVLKMGESLDALPKMISDASNYGIDQMIQNNQMVFLLLIMAGIILVVSLIKKLRIDYVRYIALGAGGILGIICLIMGAASQELGGSLMTFILLGLLSTLGLVILEFFNLTLNYKSAQNLEFEDEEYYYQVRLIPKINPVSKEKKEVKTITKDKDEDTMEHTRVAGTQRRRERNAASERPAPRRRPERPEQQDRPKRQERPERVSKTEMEERGVKPLRRPSQQQPQRPAKQSAEAQRKKREQELADFFDE